jgi:hypothetical protein
VIRAVARGVRALPRVPQPMADMLRCRLEGREQQILGSPVELEYCETAMLHKLAAAPY